MVILEPLSTTDESTLFRKMAPPCNVCCPLPTSVAPSSSLTRSQSDGAQVTIGACGITEATCVGRWPGQRAAEMHSPLGCLACFGRSNCTAAARSNNSPTAFSVLPVRRCPSHDRRMRHHKASWSCILLLDALPASVGRILYCHCPIRWPRCVLGPARPQPHLPSDGPHASPPRDVMPIG